jgi:hypothetical protein
MAKRTLLEMVQSILSDMDSEDVNALGDTLESNQIASVIKDVYEEFVATRLIPEHKELGKLTALADSEKPTHFKFPTNVRRVDTIWYDVSDDSTFEYRKLKYRKPEIFLSMLDKAAGDTTQNVKDVHGSTNLRVFNDSMPNYWTSFDDEYIVMNSYDASIEATLQTSKTRCNLIKLPVFSMEDTYVPDIDAEMFPYLQAESKSRCFSLFKLQPDQKIEQAARRQKAYLQNDKHKAALGNQRPGYGRRH